MLPFKSPPIMTSAGPKFQRLVEIMARLRAPGGCPWDRDQTFDSIKPYTLEETYEVLDAIDRRDWPNLAEELGDFILQAVFYAQMAAEESKFTIEDALDAINQKLVRRHPHVFADASAETARDVKRRWDEIKAEEKQSKGRPANGLLADVPRALPALVEAQQIASRAAAVGFDWSNAAQVLEKLHEELAEFAEAQSSASREALEDEMGDLLFVLVNLARFVQVDPEQALRRANAKFRRRFGFIERELALDGRTPRESNIDEMEALWQQAKRETRHGDRDPRPHRPRGIPRGARVAARPSGASTDIDLLPLRFFVVASRVGGQVLGAYRRRAYDRLLPRHSRH